MANPFIDSFLKKAMPGVSSNTEKANEIVRTHVLWSVGAGLVPVPVLDIAAVTAVQLDMIKGLANVYQHDYSESLGKSLLSALAGSTLARIGASFVKAIPVVGSVVGGASMAVLSGASTYAVGMVFIQHFEGGGNLQNFNIQSYKQAYDSFFEEGKDVAAKAQQTQATQSADGFSKLEKLQRLRQQGIITEEEFEAKKAELLRGL
jgi:uncharacterized protein (DUF697 family)